MGTQLTEKPRGAEEATLRQLDADPLTAQWRRGGHGFMVLAAAACGVAGAAGAVVFRLLIRVFQALFFEGPEAALAVLAAPSLGEPIDPIAAAQALPVWVLVLLPALGGLVVGPLIRYFARETRGHGIPEVMEAVALRGGVMRRRAAAVKITASAVTLGSGGSAGQEGPIVQIGAALGSAIGQALRVPGRQLRTLVGCGAAAGLSATFNAPIAGAIFAAEVIVGDFALTQFSPIVIASVVATVLSRYFLGNYPSFVVPAWELVSPIELAAYGVLGLLAGLVAVVFMRTLYRTEDLFGRLPVPDWLRPACGGLLVGGLACFVPRVMGVGYETVDEVLQGGFGAVALATFLGAKLLATSLTIGSGGSGGVFAPSIYLGAMTGGLVGSAVHAWFPESTASSGAYALVGMGALVAATSHTPISAILIIFEITQRIEIIPPLMLACVLGTLVASVLQSESIYTMGLKRRGVDLSAHQETNPLKALFVGDVMDRAPDVVQESAGFEALIDLIVRSDHTEFFVVNARGELLGTIYLAELRRVLLERDHLSQVVVAGDLVEADRPTVTADDDLDFVMQLFDRENVDEVAVVEAADARRLQGSVRKRDVIHAWNQEIMRRDLAGGIASSMESVERVHEVELGDDFVVRDVAAPHAAAGRTLGELDLRARTGALVLLIRRPALGRGAEIRVPAPDDRIEDGDVLIAAGSRDALGRLERL
jgi:CIC family chloride channel protein